MGFVDLHCHLLWDLDDGCRSPEAWIAEALETLSERAGARAMRRLCEENPRRVLAGEDLA